MARQGKFGRSGTTQNLSMLVYQLLKEQMQSELQNILTAYQTNMKAGRYSAQFNGQNVDGQFVLNYYQSMLAGFPPGSSEYETMRSQLASFEQQYKTDVQNLAIDSMNNGTKVDFGLLGNAFPNRGIDEVTLSDVRGWSEEAIAELEASGDVTQADKIKGAVFIAGFKVERDGKETALTNGEISYASYANWIGTQMNAALSAGLTKDSEAYRDLMKLHASAKKEAKKDGEAKAAEGYDKALRGALSDVDKAAEAILAAYDGPYKDDLGRLWATVDMNSLSPSYDLIKNLATLKAKGGEDAQLYESLMQSVGVSNLDELFAQAVVESNDKVSALLEQGFGATDPKNAGAFLVLAKTLQGGGLAFLSSSGVEFTSGAAKSAMDNLQTDLTAAGASFQPNEDRTVTVRGGHPDLVIASLSGLKEVLGDKASETYPWINDLAEGSINTGYLTGTIFENADTNTDGKVSSEEFGALFASGEYRQKQIDDELNIVMSNMRGEEIPGSKLNPASLVYTFIDATYHKEALKAGSIMIVNERGTTMVTDWGDTQAGDRELLPAIVTVNGVDGIVYVKPTTIKQDNNGQPQDMDLGLTNGLEVSLYRLPGNYTNKPGQMADGYVIIKGNMKDESGSSSVRSIKLTIDQFEVYARSVFGAEFDFNAFNNAQQDEAPEAYVSYTGSLAGNKEAWENIANPNSDYYVGNISVDELNRPEGPRAFPGFDPAELTFPGVISQNKDVDRWLSDVIKDPKALGAAAQEIANQKRGAGATFDTKDLLDAALQGNGVVNNLSYTTVSSLISSNPLWQSMLSNNFPTVKSAETPWAQGQRPTTPIKGWNAPDYEVPKGSPQDPRPPSERGKSPWETDTSKTKPEGSNKSIIDTIASFLGDAFRNNPSVVAPTVPKAGSAPENVTPKPSTPKIGSSSAPKSTTPTVDYTKPKTTKPASGVGTRNPFNGGRV